MNGVEWEALPARRKRGSAEKSATQVQVATTFGSMDSAQWGALPARSKKAGTTKKDSVDCSESVPGPGSGRMKVQKLQQIMDNIEARRQVTHTISTLASKDGCAGQYYECKEQSTLICPVGQCRQSICVHITSCTDLDHTADVQCHAWGANMKEAFQNMAPCMMNYMTDLTLVEVDPEETLTLTIEGILMLPMYMKVSQSYANITHASL